MFDTMNFPCYWHEDILCQNGLMCDGCEHQPAPEEKMNGKAVPVPLEWEPDITGRGMGWPICPACREMPYSTDQCLFCGQRFVEDDAVREYTDTPEELHYDCFACGGKGTVVGYRAKANGHFHGVCEACGCRVME